VSNLLIGVRIETLDGDLRGTIRTVDQLAQYRIEWDNLAGLSDPMDEQHIRENARFYFTEGEEIRYWDPAQQFAARFFETHRGKDILAAIEDPQTYGISSETAVELFELVAAVLDQQTDAGALEGQSESPYMGVK
jgi:hypothetical protein